MGTVICMIQEAHITNSKVQGLPENIHYVKNDTRVAILTSHRINACILSQFCDSDCAVVETKWENIGSVIYASVYMAHENQIPSESLIRLVEFCQCKNLPLVIGTDCNAHRELWGSSDTNQRGEQLLSYLMSSNRGHKTTFVVANRAEVLDITLLSDSLVDKLVYWYVSNEESYSDYKYIVFGLDLGVQSPVRYRNKRKTDWALYREIVCEHLSMMGDDRNIESVKDIDKETTKIADILRNAFEEACPETVIKANGFKPV